MQLWNISSPQVANWQPTRHIQPTDVLFVVNVFLLIDLGAILCELV